MPAADGFAYLRPASVDEAVAILTGQPGARPLAGGTDLVVGLRSGKVTATAVVDLTRLTGLQGIRGRAGGGCDMGALTTMAALAGDPMLTGGPLAALAQAAAVVGSPQVRSTATLGGNLCNASPAADTAPALLVLDASISVVGADGAGTLPLARFFRGPGSTALGPGQILTAVHIPDPVAGLRSIYLRHVSRLSMDIAIVGVAVAAAVDGQGRCRHARVALGAVAPVPMRAPAVEEYLTGRAIADPAVVAEAARLAAAASRPIDDLRASAAYRRRMVEVYCRRALRALAASEG